MKIDVKTLRASEAIELARMQIVDARNTIEDTIRHHGYKDRIESVEGLLTCGLVSLAYWKEDVVKAELARDDRERGPHIRFQPRGVGLDICPGCFVCGATKRAEKTNKYLHNISGFVASKTEGETVSSWFGERARLDFRPSEPNWIQVKVGACTEHLPNLNHLYAVTGKYGVIRKQDIEDSQSLLNSSVIRTDPQS